MRKDIEGTAALKKASVPKKEKKGNALIDKKAQEIFKFYPDITELHFTADGYAFFNNETAAVHASKLLDKKIIIKTKK